MSNSALKGWLDTQITPRTFVKCRALLQVSILVSLAGILPLLHIHAVNTIYLMMIMTAAFLGISNMLFDFDFSSKRFWKPGGISSAYNATFCVGFSVTLIGIQFIVLHWPGGTIMLEVGTITAIFVAAGFFVMLLGKNTRLAIALTLWSLAPLYYYLIGVVVKKIVLGDLPEPVIPWSTLSYHFQMSERIESIQLVGYSLLLGISACWGLWELKRMNVEKQNEQ